MGINVIGKTIMGSLFGKPATEMYPVVKKDFYPNTRGHIVYEAALCNYCTLCAKKCPAQAIAVDRAAQRWEIDRTRCIVCNYCVSVCSKKALASERAYSTPLTDKEERMWVSESQPQVESPTQTLSEESSKV